MEFVRVELYYPGSEYGYYKDVHSIKTENFMTRQGTSFAEEPKCL
jgi:hypothetical protein